MFYFLENDFTKAIGNAYPQVQTGIYPDNIESNFIGNYYLKEAPEDVYVSGAILSKKAKLTDLLSVSAIGYGGDNYLISEKLKNILEKYTTNKVQYFNTVVKIKDGSLIPYWIMHCIKASLEFINWKESNVLIGKLFGDKEKCLINSYADFEDLIEKNLIEKKSILIRDITLKQDIAIDNFFILRHVEGGLKIVVSETLKSEIIENKITGVLFRPIHQGHNDWCNQIAD
jgi:hypothetical protein